MKTYRFNKILNKKSLVQEKSKGFFFDNLPVKEDFNKKFTDSIEILIKK